MRHIKPYTRHLKESGQSTGIRFEQARDPLDPSVKTLMDEESAYAKQLIESIGGILDGLAVSGWKIVYDDFMNHYDATNLAGRETPGSILIRVVPFMNDDDYVFVDATFWNDEDQWGGNPLMLPYTVYDVMDHMTGDLDDDSRFLKNLVKEMVRRSADLLSNAKDEEEIQRHRDDVPYTEGGATERSAAAARKKRSRGAFGRF